MGFRVFGVGLRLGFGRAQRDRYSIAMAITRRGATRALGTRRGVLTAIEHHKRGGFSVLLNSKPKHPKP